MATCLSIFATAIVNARNFFATRPRHPEAKSVRRNCQAARSSATSCFSLADIRERATARILRSTTTFIPNAAMLDRRLQHGCIRPLAGQTRLTNPLAGRRAVRRQPGFRLRVAQRRGREDCDTISADQPRPTNAAKLPMAFPVTGDENQVHRARGLGAELANTRVFGRYFVDDFQESSHL